MASTSFSLTGRQNPSVNAPAPVVEQITEPVAVEQITEPVAVEQLAEPVVEQLAEPVVEQLAEPAQATWDASWSRTKLFEVATLLKLKVSVTSSKNDIIAALKAAS
jgi:hypothetical protein